MKLYRLRLSAIGPFPGEHEIDFGRLGASGLFLLEGPTGSGKSTIIDAVTFALYGKVAGAQASDDRMYSDFADPTSEPFVELDFETASGLYRVRRSPTYQRPKRRGQGTTTEHAKASLWRLTSPDSDPSGEPVATSLTEVGDAVLDAIGLSREQFVKTVVLPQGEFAAFLRAPAEERRPLLQKLFGTEVYESVVKQLEQRRRDAGRQRDAAARTIQDCLAGFGGALGLDAAASAELSVLSEAPDRLLEAIGSHLAAAAADVSAKQAAREAADVTLQHARTALGQARDHLQNRQSKVRLLAEQAELAGRAAAHEQRTAALDRGRRADRVRPTLVAAEKAQGEHAGADLAAGRARQLLPAALRGKPESWSRTEREHRRQVTTLEPLVAVERDLPSREEQLKLHQREVDAKQGRRAELARELDELPATIDTLRQQEGLASALAFALPTARQALAQAAERERAAVAVATLEEQLAAATAAVSQAQLAARTAQTEVNRLWHRYLDGIAGTLGARLVEGQLCPVCGSGEHPRPALPAADAVTLEGVRAAEADRDRLGKALEAARDERDDLAHDLTRAREVAAGLSPDAARRKRGEAERAVAAGEAAEGDVERLRDSLRLAEGARDDKAKAVAVLDQEIAAELTRIEAEAQTLDRDRRQVEQQRAGEADVAHYVERLGRELNALTAAMAAAGELAIATRLRDQRQEEARQAAQDNGFDSPAAAAAAWLERADLDTLGCLVAEHDDQVNRVERELAAPALADLDVTVVPDLEPLVRADDEAAQQRDRAQGELATARNRLDECRSRADGVRAAVTAAADVIARTAPVIRMADLVAASTPDNARRMTLPTFVLLELFGDVVAHANQRLLVMSDGRYSLEHVQDKDGGRKSGLGLEVRDHQTDRPRKTGTLSGGETFYCSLALALGLADVVTAEAGGIDLGTLFVDEGFGTLDPETLDHVMDVLSRLRSGGRTVGIVSHVGELKDRISERVEVRRCAEGHSRLRVRA